MPALSFGGLLLAIYVFYSGLTEDLRFGKGTVLIRTGLKKDNNAIREDRLVMDQFMQAAIEEAYKGQLEGGIPIGSVLVRKNIIIGRGHNRRIQEGDPIVHAEIDCLRNAGRIGTYRDAVLYSTLMPCYLCAGAAVQFGIKKVVVGESQNFTGARTFMEEHGIEVIDLDLGECVNMMQEFIAQNKKLWNEDIGEL